MMSVFLWGDTTLDGVFARFAFTFLPLFYFVG
jgi:hypothetical protein